MKTAGCSLVGWGTYGDEVESAVQAAAELGNVDVKGELVAEEREHLVLVGAFHQVHTGADVCPGLAVGDKLEGEGIAAHGGAVL